VTLRNEAAPVLALDGTWEFQLGAQAGTIVVPGCWEAQGYSRHLDGPARYRRMVTIPADWASRRILLEFDALSYAAVVRWNGQTVGEHRGLWTPFAFDVTAAARGGDRGALELLDQAAIYLGTALANLVNLVNPDMIILGGMFAAGADLFLPRVEETMRRRSFAGLGEQVALRVTTFGRKVGVIGAAALALDAFFYRQEA